MVPQPSWVVVGLTALITAGAIVTGSVRDGDSPPWRNPAVPTAARVDDLLRLLTTAEKVSMLQAAQPAVSRLGLPSYSFARECERGDTSGRTGTAFPSGLALGSTFDPLLINEVAFATAIEVRANVNVDVAAGGPFGSSCFGPVSNLVKDSRWGRTNEMIGGEDPTLSRILARAFAWGLQARPARNATFDLRMVSSIAKHLNAYAGPEGYGYTFDKTTRRFNVNAHLTEREYREFFLPAFRGSAEANISGFMCSYSAITLTDHLDRSNNTPACANPYLLESITRGELGLHGYILSDAGAAAFTAEVEISPSAGHWHATNRTFGHGFAKSPADAAIKCIEAGLDLELTCCGAPEVYPTLVQSIVSGKISVELVDRALRRTLPFRFELGAMDPLDVQARNPYNRLDARNVSAPWMLGLARRAAERAIVLLKNTPIARAVVDATVLPLSEGNLKDKVVCVIGPNANDTVAQMGGYVNQHPLYVSTPFVAMATRLTNVAREVRLLVGCSNYTACPHFDLPSIAECELSVVVLGLTNDARSKEENGDACGCPYGDAIEGECCDRQDVQLPGKQAELLDTVVSATAGRPVILVSINAGMLDLTAAKANPGVHSILNAAYLGMESGIALVNTLFGDANPAGRLPLTYYANISAALGKLGDSYAMHPDIAAGVGGKTYRYFQGDVIWPFGFGLSYTSFAYQTTIDKTTRKKIGPCDNFTLSLVVQNTGEITGDEVVQLYLSLRNATVIVPVRQLVSFQRLRVEAHSEATVTFTVVPDDRFVLSAGDYNAMIEPGLIDVFIGGSSDPSVSPGVHFQIEVVGDPIEVASCPGGRSFHGTPGSPDAARWMPTETFPVWP